MIKRLGARVIDVFVLGIPVSLISLLIFGDTSGPGASTFQFVVGIAYEIGFIALRGATVGKQLLGIKVVREDGGGLLSFGAAALRWLIPTLGILACLIGVVVVYLSPFFDSTKRFQGWHDKVAKDLVVQV
jgi:uncharacterized RDD family membrane protein YckC